MRPGPKSLHIILVVQYPTKVELVITLNTTKAIGPHDDRRTCVMPFKDRRGDVVEVGASGARVDRVRSVDEVIE